MSLPPAAPMALACTRAIRPAPINAIPIIILLLSKPPLSRESRPLSGCRQRVIAWLSGQSTLQQIHRSPHSFHPREDDIFMLDRQPAVITVETKAVTKLAPPLFTVSNSQRDVTPSAILDMLVPNGFQATGQIQHSIVQISVLGMHMMDRIAKGIDCRQRVGTHPKQVT